MEESDLLATATLAGTSIGAGLTVYWIARFPCGVAWLRSVHAAQSLPVQFAFGHSNSQTDSSSGISATSILNSRSNMAPPNIDLSVHIVSIHP